MSEGGGKLYADRSGFGQPLTLEATADVDRLASGNGIQCDGGSLVSTVNAAKVATAVRASQRFSYEVWVKTSTLAQYGPARILSQSPLETGTSHHDVMLGQDGSKLQVRVTPVDGVRRYFTSLPGVLTGERQHIVATYDGQVVTAYVDGAVVLTQAFDAELAWSDAYQLTVCDESTQNRTFRGTVRLIAVYDRALTAAEVEQNRQAGPTAIRMGCSATGLAEDVRNHIDDDCDGLIDEDYRPIDASGRSVDGLVAYFPFSEGTGSVAMDRSAYGQPLALEFSSEVSWLGSTNGIQCAGGGAQTIEAAAKLSEALMDTHRMTYETWVVPANLTQDGPTRMGTSGASSSEQQNFILGQSGAAVEMRLNVNWRKTLRTGDILETRLTHLVATYDGEFMRIYMDGELVAEKAQTGALTLNTGFPVSVCNEGTVNRDYHGIVRMVAWYNRALTPAEIVGNFNAGPSGVATTCVPTGTPESVCNGIDDDCDGVTDEDFQAVAITCGEGQCANTQGEVVCVNGTTVDLCDPFEGASVEICDGVDNDCDGEADDQNACGCLTDADCDDANACTTNVCGASGTCEVAEAVECQAGLSCDPSTAVCQVSDVRTHKGLVAFYPFVEGEGQTVYDRAENGRTPVDLTLQGAVSWLPGENGVSCDGGVLSSVVPATSINDAVNLTGKMTFEAWGQTQALSDAQVITSVGESSGAYDFRLRQLSGDDLETRIRTNASKGKSGVANGQAFKERNAIEPALTHIVITYDGTYLRLYVDGVEDDDMGLRGRIKGWKHPLNLCGDGDGSHAWLGTLRMVALYDRPLKAHEVAANYNAGPSAVDGTAAATTP